MSVFNYDDIPPGYYYHAMQEGSAVQRFWHRRKFSAVAQLVSPGDYVVDIGCGPGSFLSVLGEERSDVRSVGVDIANPQIEFAKEHVGAKFPDGRISFLQLDPQTNALPFKDDTFDVATCIEVIEHIHPFHAHRALEESKRVLKPTGKLIVTTPNYTSLWPLIEFCLERLSPVKYHEQHISKFTPNSLVKFVESAGFEVTSIKTIFVVAPFLAAISNSWANFVYDLEGRTELQLGSLLVLEAKKIV